MARQRPFSTDIDLSTGKMSVFERQITRHASDMKGYFHIDLDDADPLIYEYYERDVPNEAGQIIQNITIIYPGTIDGEYYMTKGHYHVNKKCSEVYLCLSGQGYLIMQTSSGEWDVKEYLSGRTIYVPPGWAHRSVNTGNKPLVLFAVFPGDSGHNYGKISRDGFLIRIIRDENEQACFLIRGEAVEDIHI